MFSLAWLATGLLFFGSIVSFFCIFKAKYDADKYSITAICLVLFGTCVLSLAFHNDVLDRGNVTAEYNICVSNYTKTVTNANVSEVHKSCEHLIKSI